jgi:hypothetical protein
LKGEIGLTGGYSAEVFLSAQEDKERSRIAGTEGWVGFLSRNLGLVRTPEGPEWGNKGYFRLLNVEDFGGNTEWESC